MILVVLVCVDVVDWVCWVWLVILIFCVGLLDDVFGLFVVRLGGGCCLLGSFLDGF